MKFHYDRGISSIELEPQYVNIERAQEIVNRLYSGNKVYPIPYSYIKNDTLDTLNLVMQAMGLYTFPTLEVCEWLNSQIDDNPELEPHSAIEICAGTGWIGRQLGIPITDVKNMENSAVQEIMLKSLSIPTLYAGDTIQLEASEAVKVYSPDIVIGSFVTSRKRVDKIDKKKAMTVGIKMPYGGVIKQSLMDIARNEIIVGVDIESIVKKVYKVILIVNNRTHMHESYFKIPHKSYSFPWLITRGDVSQARILVFENRLW